MIGKKAGNSLYVHLSAVHKLPEKYRNRFHVASGHYTKAMNINAIPSVNCNIVVFHPDYVDFIYAEDFDNVYEPILGKRNRIHNDGTTEHIPKPAKPRVLHQRYKTVLPSYCGFDIENDKDREKWYREFFDAKRMAGAGFHHKWMEMLDEIKAEDEEEEVEFLNKYVCPGCKHKWHDVWDCMVDSECPNCNMRDISPIKSVELA